MQYCDCMQFLSKIMSTLAQISLDINNNYYYYRLSENHKYLLDKKGETFHTLQISRACFQKAGSENYHCQRCGHL